MSAASYYNLNSVEEEDYRALVCILLAGGNDSFNMLVPTNKEHYDQYQEIRSNQALEKQNLLKLQPVAFNQKELGLHPAMPELKTLFDEGKLAILCNVGTLVQPTTKQSYQDGLHLPLGLFSHADQDKQWQTSIPQTTATTGWAGRLADLVYTANSNQEISMNISLSGKNLFQLGNQVQEYSILPSEMGSVGIRGFNGRSVFDQIKTKAVNSLMERQYQDIFKQTYADIIHASQNTHELFSKAVGGSTIYTEYSESGLSQRLLMVARALKVRKQLGLKRQTFFIRFAGWDHHDELLNNQREMLEVLSKAMSEFQTSLIELELEDQVTTFTISDFARTLTSNGNGTDHAWGGNVLVMGKQVKGKEIYGTYPDLRLDSNIEVGNGILIPGISTDEYFAELALWFGMAKSDLPILFPNIGNFYDALSANPPIGFMDL